ncbi:alpha-xylosidase [Inconstantimicrobium mannanitabidum]|uniref:Alpha-xylosidase n=1 Tax=Inconstantimicrobium mannanitabidum TaxID=1604901 RepID=A0ACB5RFH9_9CLOT|nr:alpha-xylosidase [Clostridium sp. TW13]GKX67842.1 alpha-xylosidase [Clostridium sp. TW13]
MKFSNGCWLNKDGYQVSSPAEVYSTKIEDNVLTMYSPCRKITQRGDTLGGPVITYKISSPLKNVIRVQAYHYMGINQKATEFELNEDKSTKVEINDLENEVTFKSGNLTAKINKENWLMEFLRGEERLTFTGNRNAAYIVTDEKEVFMREQLSLSVGELVYGLGERFSPFVKNGQTVDIWNEDGGTSTEQSYKNIPFYMTNKGYGVFVNDPGKVSFEVGSEKVTKVQFSVPGESLDYFIIGGDSMKEVIENYTTLTGKPALPPAWTYGLWLTTSFTTNYDEETVTSFVDGMAERDIPLEVFHFDCFWMKDYNWCNFQWDKRVFPDPQGMLKRLKAKGLKICVWINPYIAQESSLFEEGKKNGYFIKTQNGDVWQWDMWQPAMAIVDFTNPAACKWYGDKLRVLMDMGVDCFKTDFGERIPTDAKYFDGSDPFKMHNYYTYLYNQVVFNVIKEKKGENEAAVFARSATVGGQKFPVHWGGDCSADFESMAESLRGGLSLCMSGFGFWSHDMGGFESTATPDVYKRWAAFGLLSSHSRLHGSTSYRVPWVYDEEAVDVVRFFTKLKCSIMPYLFNTANVASATGIPMMRSMILEFQNDLNCNYVDRQYMLGDSILVAPIFNDKGEANYYLPEGTWTNFITGEKYEGGRWVKEHHGYLTVPMMVRENSIIAVGNQNNKPEYDYRENVSLYAYELKEDVKATARVLDTKSNVQLEVEAIKTGNTIAIKAVGTDKPWSFVLKNVKNVSKVDGAEFSVEEDGTRITLVSGNCEVKCHLA